MYVVAGPNGAGKSTLTRGARERFGLELIDADAIQRESEMDSGAAWAEALRRCRDALANRRSFWSKRRLQGAIRPGRRPIWR
jgi:predicted ABC-type ATPase